MHVETRLRLHPQDHGIIDHHYRWSHFYRYVRFILVVHWKMLTTKRDLSPYPYFTVRFPRMAHRRAAVRAWVRKVWKSRDPRYTVVAHRVDQEYGGPQEGGWWYQVRYVEERRMVWRKRDLDSVMDALVDEYPNTGRSYSVLGGDDYRVRYYDRFTAVYDYEDDYEPYC